MRVAMTAIYVRLPTARKQWNGLAVDTNVNQVYILVMADRSLLDRIYDAHRLLAAIEAEPRRYGTDRLFYASEIHTLVCIGECPDMNLTTLAARLEVSKSAASKFVAKLLQSDYITKTKAPTNARDVLFRVTAKGRRAIEGHRQFEARAFGPLEAIESRLRPAERKVIAGFLDNLERELNAPAS
jgi:DNA-binding MarR family transcriptional regulator